MLRREARVAIVTPLHFLQKQHIGSQTMQAETQRTH
jgi:hypothetical protein